MRLRIDLAYDGTDFHGWAKQRDQRTVQGEVEAALRKILRIPADTNEAEYPQLVVAGRTDAGVHASHQVCHIDIDDDAIAQTVGNMRNTEPLQALTYRLRHVVPADITIQSIVKAPDGFDARFSATDRMYIYRIADGLCEHDPRTRSFVWNIDNELDIDAMNLAMDHAVGLHDFGSFALPNPGGTTIREVKFARWERVQDQVLTSQQYRGGASQSSTQAIGAEPCETRLGYSTQTVESGLVVFTIIADAFARNMVRCLVNASVQIGKGRKTEDWFADKIANPSRDGFTGPAPALGLTLERVNYPSAELLQARAEAIRAPRTL